MSPPEVWGPPIWTLFHVLAEKINENAYPYFMGQLFHVIKMICSALPCPECTQDASVFLGKVKLQDLKTKEHFKNMIYLFHNYVNAKKRKPLYNYSNLEIYKKYNIIIVFNKFISVYHTRGNMKLLAESFQRQLIIKNVKNWFSRNFQIFTPSPTPNINQNPSMSNETNIVMDNNYIIVENNIVSAPTVESVSEVAPTAESVSEVAPTAESVSEVAPTAESVS